MVMIPALLICALPCSTILAYIVIACGTGVNGKLSESAARVSAAFVAAMTDDGNAPASFCTKSTAILSPFVTMRNPRMGFASVCEGIETRVNAAVSVTAVHVAPLSVVICTTPVPTRRFT